MTAPLHSLMMIHRQQPCVVVELCVSSGACIYFVMCFRGLEDPVKVYEQIESDARDEAMAFGGTLSHHHGVGKLRRKWMTEAAGETGMAMLRALKTQLDPKNILCARNIGL